MADRVRVTKHEYASVGGDPTDETDFIDDIDPNEDGVDARSLFLQSDTSSDSDVEVTRDSSDRMTFKDGDNTTPVPLTDLIGGGLTPTTHRDIDQLVHMLAENAYYEVTYAGPRVTAETWWTDAAKTAKIREVTYGYTGSRVSSETWRQYDASGVQIATFAVTYTYTGPRVTSANLTYLEP